MGVEASQKAQEARTKNKTEKSSAWHQFHDITKQQKAKGCKCKARRTFGKVQEIARQTWIGEARETRIFRIEGQQQKKENDYVALIAPTLCTQCARPVSRRIE